MVHDPQNVQEYLAAFYLDEDDEQTAVEEALAELEAGQGRPFAEFTREFFASFDARYRTK